MKGKLIVIDGLDGSGKTTQHEQLISLICEPSKNSQDSLLSPELLSALRELLPSVRSLSFPNYESAAAGPIKMYLEGAFGTRPGDVNAYAASSFYAVDRFASFKADWGSDYLSGQNFLSARYTSSNLFHQMSKLPQYEWDDFISWLVTYEYDLLEIPQPDLVLFLDMPVAVSKSLISSRYGGDESRRDIHESDITYLEKSREAALYASEQLDYKIISCGIGEQPLPREVILKNIVKTILEAFF